MNEQSEILRKSNQNVLTQKLQTELEFHSDETGEWLIQDEFTESNGINGYEWLPTRVRISSNGSRLEFGVKKVDLEKTLELAGLAGDNAQGLEHVRTFWPSDSRVTVAEDDEWFFMGSEIEPTAEGFESDYQDVHSGLEVAITAASKGMSYEEMKADNWFGIWVESAETKREGGRTILFPEKGDEDDEVEGASCSIEDRWDRQAANLRSFHIDSYKKSVSNVPTTLTIDGKVIEGNNGWLIGHSGIDDVRISDSWHEPREGDNRSNWNHYTVRLPITEGVEVTTVDDISKLSRAFLEIRYGGTTEPVVSEYPIRVVVEDHAVKMESEDGKFAFEVQEPACAECRTPIWQFRNPTKEEWEKQNDPLTSEIIMPKGMSRGNGVYHFTLGENREDRKMYCYDDCIKLEEEFAQEYPLARRANAIAAVRQKLDEEGYGDVDLLADQTWPVRPDKGAGLELFAYVEYEREGRKIIRRAGRPIITYDGQISLEDLPSRQFIEFR